MLTLLPPLRIHRDGRHSRYKGNLLETKATDPSVPAAFRFLDRGLTSLIGTVESLFARSNDVRHSKEELRRQWKEGLLGSAQRRGQISSQESAFLL